MNNIKSTDCMVVVLTDTGVRSQFVNQEVGAARSINKPVIPTLEKKVKGKIGGLAGLELIIFDKAKPKQAIREVSSYVSRLKLSLELEMKEREDTLKTIAVITFIVFFCSLAVFWLFVKSNECIQASACRQYESQAINTCTENFQNRLMEKYGGIKTGSFDKLFGKKKSAHEKLKADLLNKIEAYAKAMHYLSTCGSPFDERKFEELDGILEEADVAFGSAKRAEMIEESKFILPSRTADGRLVGGGTETLRLNLMNALTQGFKAFNQALIKISPDKDTGKRVIKILKKYQLPRR